MPVVTIVAPPAGDSGALVRSVAARMAAALGLPPDGVIAIHTVSGASSSEGWVVVSVHGGDRGALAAPALDAAEAAVRGWAADAGLALQGVWTEWLLPRPAA